MASEDEDEFLYGSDEETENNATDATKPDSGTSIKVDQKKENEKKDQKEGEENEDEDEEDSEEEDSDSDFELIVNAPGSEDEKKATKVGATTSSIETVANSAGTSEDGVLKQTDSATTVTVTSNEAQRLGGIDIDKVATFEGKPLTQLDLEALKDKPWRLPGADVTDYFNYGFNEFTWINYCNKQDKLRANYNIGNFLNPAAMAAGTAGSPAPPAIPGLPAMPMAPSQMPGFAPGIPGMFPSFMNQMANINPGLPNFPNTAMPSNVLEDQGNNSNKGFNEHNTQTNNNNNAKNINIAKTNTSNNERNSSNERNFNNTEKSTTTLIENPNLPKMPIMARTNSAANNSNSSSPAPGSNNNKEFERSRRERERERMQRERERSQQLHGKGNDKDRDRGTSSYGRDKEGREKDGREYRDRSERPDRSRYERRRR